MEYSQSLTTEGMSRRRRFQVEGVRLVLNALADLTAQPRIPGEIGSVIHPSEVVEIPEPTPPLTQPVIERPLELG